MHPTLTEQQLEELRPLAAVIEGAIKDTPIRLGTDDWGTVLAATVLARVAAYMGGVVPPVASVGDWLTRGSRDLSIPEQMPAGHCDHAGPHPGFTCGEVDQTRLFWEAQWAREANRPAPAPDEDTMRAARRDSLDILLARLEHNGVLSSGEAAMLRQHIEKETSEHDTMRLVAAGNKRHVQVMYAELEQTQAGRDSAYRERAQLLALLASLHPSVIAPAPDVGEPEWQILYLRIGGKQASWHIAPQDAELFAHVEHVPTDDSRAQWDGHTTEEKYALIGKHAARLYAEARGRAETTVASAAALDGTEQPTTEAATCTATIADTDNPATRDRCVAPAGHYDEGERIEFGDGTHDPKGWHRDGRGHVWSDRAATATPHNEQPTATEA